MSEPTEPEALPKIPETDRKSLIKLMRRISWKNDLHCVIDAKTGGVSEGPDAVPLLLANLKNSIELNWRQRTAALIALRYLPVPPEDSAEAARVIAKIMLDRDTNIGQRVIMRGLWLLMRWLAGLTPLLVLGALFVYLPPDTFLHNALTAVATIYICFFLIYTLTLPIASPLYDMVRTGDVRMEAAQTLAVLQMPESVGALAQASRSVSLGADFVRNALMRLLPTLTQKHYGQIGSDATPELCALLTHNLYDQRFAREILFAIGKVGDGRAVGTVEKLTQLRRESPLRELAASVLPVLMARREQENHSALLLRGSSAPPVGSRELLRAAQSAPTPPELLLRPASEASEPPPPAEA